MSGTIILGDVHLGANTSIGKVTPGQYLNSSISDQLDLLEWVLRIAEQEIIENIIITGDLFEEVNPDSQLFHYFLNWVISCQLSNVNIHIIMGNHDFELIGGQFKSSLDIISSANLNNISIYKNMETIYIKNVAYTFLPYRDRKSMGTSSNADAKKKIMTSLLYERSSIPLNYTKVVIGHYAIEGAIPVGNEIDDVSNEIFLSPSDFNGFDYVWMGHVHKPQVMSKVNPYVAHIGSMDISNFGETDQKKHIILFDIDNYNDFKKMTLPTRRLQKMTITVPKGTEDTTKYVLDQIDLNEPTNNAVVRCEVVLETGDLKSVNRVLLEKALLKKGVHNVSGITESKKNKVINKKVDHSIDTSMDIDSAAGLYAKECIAEEDQPGFISLIKQLALELK